MSSQQSSGGLGFAGALALLFIGLKLGGVVGWSWWWVLAPIWIPAAIAGVVMIVLGLLWVGFDQAEKRDRRRRDRPGPSEHGPAHRWGRRG